MIFVQSFWNNFWNNIVIFFWTKTIEREWESKNTMTLWKRDLSQQLFQNSCTNISFLILVLEGFLSCQIINWQWWLICLLWGGGLWRDMEMAKKVVCVGGRVGEGVVNRLTHVLQVDTTDCWVWKLDPTQRYTIKGAYNYLKAVSQYFYMASISESDSD